MRATFALIGSSWDFFRRQPALLSVGIWMLFLPTLGIDALNVLHDSGIVTPDIKAGAAIGILLLILLLSLVIVWGQCCIYVVGRRMLQAKAGRARTSFGALATQAKPFVIPFVLTHVLRACITLLWTLLLVIPGIIYALRTTFAPVIIVGENKAYRAALQRSKDAVKGHSWRIFGTLLLLVILLFVLPFLVIGLASLPLPDTLPSHGLVFVVTDIWMALSTILMNLCLIRMYEQYRAPAPR